MKGLGGLRKVLRDKSGEVVDSLGEIYTKEVLYTRKSNSKRYSYRRYYFIFSNPQLLILESENYYTESMDIVLNFTSLTVEVYVIDALSNGMLYIPPLQIKDLRFRDLRGSELEEYEVKKLVSKI